MPIRDKRELNMKDVKLLLLSILIYCPLVVAQIEDDVDDLTGLYDDEELISIATGTQKQARFAPSVATVILAEDIIQSGARTLDEALEMVPGLHVSSSFNRQDAIYSIRGIHTGQNPQVLLLIDGVQIAQLFSGARPYNYSLPVANIDRIEVIRGPGSAVYGADAFAGVISVTTKTSRQITQNEGGVRVGSFDTREAWLNVGGQLGGLNVSASIQHVTTGGDSTRVVDQDAQSQADISLIPATSLAPGELSTNHELLNSKLKIAADKWSIDIFSWNLANAGLGTGGLQSLDYVGGDSSDFAGISFETVLLDMNDDWSIKGRLDSSIFNQDAEFVLRPPGSSFNFGPFGIQAFPEGMIGNPNILEKTYSGEVTSFYRGHPDHNVRLAIGFRTQELTAGETKNFATPNFISGDFVSLINVKGTPDIFIRDDEREHYYVSAQNEWRFANDWELTAGVRYDTFTQFGDSINPRLALVWSTAHNLTSKFLYGRAFRAPSFSELFAQNNLALVGNPDLEPETIDTYEVAFDYRPNQNVDLKLNLFLYQIKDLVEAQFGVLAANNLEQSGRGFEFEAEWRATKNFKLIGNYAWQNAEDDDTNTDVPNAPQQQLYLRSVWEVDNNITASAVLNWVADRERSVGDLRSDIDDYTVVDLVVQYRNLIDGLDISLIGKNVFDEDVREPSTGQFPSMPEIPGDYPLEGSSATIEFKYNFDS